MGSEKHWGQTLFYSGARLYNPGLGRMLSSDPRENEYPWQSTYAYFSNSPISTLDINGEGGVAVVDVYYWGHIPCRGMTL